MPTHSEPPLKILAVEPWLGGSHAAFLESWGSSTEHEVEVVGLADRHWKWRMQAGAWELARKLGERQVPDLLLVSDYLDLPAFYGFLPSSWSGIPAVLYMHENQLTYPVQAGAPESTTDNSYGFTNILSCLRARTVVFNSAFHRDDFGKAAELLLGRLPKPTPLGEFRQRMQGARVIAPGVDIARLPLGPGNGEGSPLRILFNHRWQYDKDPVAFLDAMLRLQATELPFELVLLGERFFQLPDGAEPRLADLSPQIVHQGFLPSREEYVELLASCDLSVSTAQHEFFGISTVESMSAGVHPLLPNRLSYPEVIGLDLQQAMLYKDEHDLHDRLVEFAGDPSPIRDSRARGRLRCAAEVWSSENTTRDLDALCRELCEPREVTTP